MERKNKNKCFLFLNIIYIYYDYIVQLLVDIKIIMNNNNCVNFSTGEEERSKKMKKITKTWYLVIEVWWRWIQATEWDWSLLVFSQETLRNKFEMGRYWWGEIPIDKRTTQDEEEDYQTYCYSSHSLPDYVEVGPERKKKISRRIQELGMVWCAFTALYQYLSGQREKNKHWSLADTLEGINWWEKKEEDTS